MPEAVMVTIRYEGKEQDYSLPLMEPIEQWLPVLGKALGAGADPALYQEGKELILSRSLAAQYIWEGTVLTAVRR